MTLNTDRLTIREISLRDMENIHALHSLPETDEFNTLGIPGSIQTTEKIVNDWIIQQNSSPPGSYIFCIEHIYTKQFIGLIALIPGKSISGNAEVWYKLHVHHWRKGYATEALKKIVDFGFNELKLHRIEAGCAVENIRSSKVLEKAGMIREGIKRKNLQLKGQWADSYLYAILDEDYSLRPLNW